LILGLDFYGNTNSAVFQTINVVNNIYRLELSKCIIDEIEVELDTSLPYSNVKETWQYSTVLLADFNNSLEAGNIENGGVPIEYIAFKKRKATDLVWQDVAIMPYSTATKLYQYIDNLVKATEDYEYAIVPITAGVEGEYLIADITCSFDGTWVIDKNTAYQLIQNVQYTNIDNAIQNSVLETFAQYPIVVYGQTDYHKGTISSYIVTQQTIDNGNIDVQSERINREQLLNFFNNRKPKILKDGAGRYFLVTLLNVKEVPNNNQGQATTSVSFDFVEIGDAEDTTTLANNGF
jgi:hypothetical protein